MEEFWLEVGEKNKDLISPWNWGFVYGFFYENSLYDASKLYKFIEEKFKDSSLKRHINVGLANVLTGQYKSFKDQHTPAEFVKVL